MKRSSLFILLTLMLLVALPAADASQLRVKASKANVRLTPDIGAAIVRQVSQNAVLEIVKKTGAWYQVSLPPEGVNPKEMGYIHENVVEEIGASVEEAPQPPKSNQERPIPETSRAQTTKVSRVTPLPRTEKFKKIWLRAHYQVGFDEPTTSFAGSIPLYHDSATLAADYRLAKANLPFVAIGYRLSPALGIELGASFASRDLDAGIAAAIPHPLLFNAMRTASGADSFPASQTEVHLGLVYTLRMGSLGLNLTAGPAMVMGKATLISGFSVQDSYPYTTVNITYEATEQSKSGFGFFAGAGADYSLGKSLAIGIEARYVAATIKFEPISGQSLNLKMGGLRAGGGIKFSF